MEEMLLEGVYFGVLAEHYKEGRQYKVRYWRNRDHMPIGEMPIMGLKNPWSEDVLRYSVTRLFVDHWDYKQRLTGSMGEIPREFLFDFETGDVLHGRKYYEMHCEIWGPKDTEQEGMLMDGANTSSLTAQPEVIGLAIEKLDKAIEANKEPYAKIILEHIKGRVKESESLAKDVLQEHKNWERCWNYIYKKAAKEPRKGNCAAVQDSKVFEWAEDYFHADDKAEVKKEAKAGTSKGVKDTKKGKKKTEPKAKKTMKPVEPEGDVNEEDPEDIDLDMNKPEPSSEGPELAAKTLYYKTGDIYWKVEKGQPVPTADSLKEAKKITAKEYFAHMTDQGNGRISAAELKDIAANAEKAVQKDTVKAPDRDPVKKPKKKKPKNEIEGQMSIFDLLGG